MKVLVLVLLLYGCATPPANPIEDSRPGVPRCKALTEPWIWQECDPR